MTGPRLSPAIPLVAIACLALASCGEQHVIGAGAIEASCAPFVAGPDLALCSAGFVPTAARAVDIGRDRAIVLAARHEAVAGLVPVNLGAGGGAAIYRLTPDGRKVLSVSVLGAEIDDLEVAPGTGHIAVVGRPFGVALLAADGRTLLWQAPASGQRVGVGHDDVVAVLDRVRHEVRVFAAGGAPIASFIPAVLDQESADVAVHGPSRTIVLTGSVPAPGSDAGRPRQPLLDGFAHDGTRKWRGYGWDLASLSAKQLTASTAGVRVTVGRDGWLYYLGESHGGNTSHGRDPRDLDAPVPGGSGDPYETPFNTSQFITFVARLDAATGRLLAGKTLLARAPGTSPPAGVATHAMAVAADERGHVLVAGTHPCCMPAFASRTVAGQALSSSAEDAFVVLLAPDLGGRLLWTTFSRGGPSQAAAVAISGGTAALLAAQDGPARTQGPLITVSPALTPAPGAAGHLSIWPTP